MEKTEHENALAFRFDSAGDIGSRTNPCQAAKKQEHYPNFRLPKNSDLTGGWKRFFEPSSPPFFALGDFIWDGQSDVAPTLLHESKEGHWKVVVFHASGPSHQVFGVSASPEDRKGDPRYGRNYGPVQDVGIALRKRCSDGKPCLELQSYEASSFEYFWRHGRYEEVNTSD